MDNTPGEGPRNFASTGSDDSFLIVIVGDSPARSLGDSASTATTSAVRVADNTKRLFFGSFHQGPPKRRGNSSESVWPPYTPVWAEEVKHYKPYRHALSFPNLHPSEAMLRWPHGMWVFTTLLSGSLVKTLQKL